MTPENVNDILETIFNDKRCDDVLYTYLSSLNVRDIKIAAEKFLNAANSEEPFNVRLYLEIPTQQSHYSKRTPREPKADLFWEAEEGLYDYWYKDKRFLLDYEDTSIHADINTRTCQLLLRSWSTMISISFFADISFDYSCALVDLADESPIKINTMLCNVTDIDLSFFFKAGGDYFEGFKFELSCIALRDEEIYNVLYMRDFLTELSKEFRDNGNNVYVLIDFIMSYIQEFTDNEDDVFNWSEFINKTLNLCKYNVEQIISDFAKIVGFTEVNDELIIKEAVYKILHGGAVEDYSAEANVEEDDGDGFNTKYIPAVLDIMKIAYDNEIRISVDFEIISEVHNWRIAIKKSLYEKLSKFVGMPISDLSMLESYVIAKATKKKDTPTLSVTINGYDPLFQEFYKQFLIDKNRPVIKDMGVSKTNCFM